LRRKGNQWFTVRKVKLLPAFREAACLILGIGK